MAQDNKLLSAAAQKLIDEARQKTVGDALLQELGGTAPAVFESKAAKAAAAPKVFPRYTAEAMVQLMVDHPEYTHAEFAAHFGYKAAWFAGVLVSQNLQAALEPRRHEVSNPMLTGTMDDIMRAMVLQSVTVLSDRLNSEKASDDLVIKAIAAGTKALGMGTAGQAPVEAPKPATLDDLAQRLSKPKLIEATPARDWTVESTLGELPR